MIRFTGLLAALLVLCGALLAASVAPAYAEKRVALIIGNGTYANASRLPNPKHDAEDVAAALKRNGFETIVGLDLTQAQMQEMAIRFSRAARTAEVALFYYSGHAMQYAGVNYLMPVDAKLTDEADLRRLMRTDEIVADLQQARNLRILVLDACRDNPMAQALKRSIGRTRAASLGRGLARIESPQGMIVAFATQSGRTADDGAGRNSPYTTAFLNHIESNEEIGRVFRRVSADVYAATDKQQLPELSLSLIGEFYLRGRPAASSPQKAAPPPPNPAARAWADIKDSGDKTVLEAFLKEYPQGLYAALAKARLREMKEKTVARLPESSTAQPEPEVYATPRELTLALQKELKRVGCDPGKIDGVWGRQGSKVLAEFNRYTKLDLPTGEPTQQSVDAVRATRERVCPLVCGLLYQVKGNRCVKKICPSGRKINSRGQCVIVAVKKSTAPPVTKKKTPPTKDVWTEYQECREKFGWAACR